jgi:uncharacterized membrane protein YdbT with pleckstrin-like domain
MATIFERIKSKSTEEKSTDSGFTKKEEKKKQERKSHLPIPESVKQEKPTRRSLSAYMVKPNNIHFETQDREEKIVLLLRRHVVTNIGWILMSVAMAVLPLMALVIPGPELLPFRFQVIMFVSWYLFVIAFVFENFLSWYYNVYIITDERIVDVDFHSLLYKEVSQAKIDNIQDVTFVMGGMVRALFNYGTVYIQTAGEQLEFDFDDVPNPDRVAKILNELILEEEREKLEGRVN